MPGHNEELVVLSREVARFEDNPYAHHLRSQLALRNYQRIADRIAQQVAGGRLLDWGAGFGQMSWLLRRRGFTVTAYDYLPDSKGLSFGVTGLDPAVSLVTSPDPVVLPFRESSFDVALSCGVLEHVSDEDRSLDELRRVLRPGGWLLIYQLPQSWSWMEFFIRRFHLGYAHPRRYTPRSVRRLLERHGFRAIQVRRANMLPKNFTGLPQGLRRTFDIAPGAVLEADQTLARLPGLRAFAGVLEISARRY